MAYRAQQINPWVGVGAATLVAALILGTLGVVAWRAPDAGQLEPSDWAAIRFTVSQALLSALISVALAIPVARGLSRRQFFGRSVLITLLGAPFLLPVIVACKLSLCKREMVDSRYPLSDQRFFYFGSNCQAAYRCPHPVAFL